MLKLFFLCVFFFIILLCNSQQTLVLENLKNGKVKSVKLPAAVYIKFINSGYQNLLLEKVIGDSFFFKKYYNQTKNYDCALDDISAVNFPKKSDVFIQSAFVFFTGMALFLTPLSIAGSFHKSVEAGDPTQGLAIIFGIPFSTISIITSASLIKKLPKNFNTKKWRIYVK